MIGRSRNRGELLRDASCFPHVTIGKFEGKKKQNRSSAIRRNVIRVVQTVIIAKRTGKKLCKEYYAAWKRREKRRLTGVRAVVTVVGGVRHERDVQIFFSKNYPNVPPSN